MEFAGAGLSGVMFNETMILLPLYLIIEICRAVRLLNLLWKYFIDSERSTEIATGLLDY